MGMLDLFREWMEQRHGKSLPRRRTGLVKLEALESRLVLSPMLTGTTLTVNGTAADDTISVKQDLSTGVTVVIDGTTTNLLVPEQRSMRSTRFWSSGWR